MVPKLTDKEGKELNSSQAIQKAANRLKSIIEECAVYILHLSGAIPFHHVRRALYRLGGVRIGRGSSIHMGTRFYQPGNVEIGEDTIVGEDAVLDGRAKLVIGNHVGIATGVMVYNSEHDIADPQFRAVTLPVTIDDYVFIGPRAIILPGVKIGRGAVVAAGAVVTKDVAPLSIVAGVPAKQIAERNPASIGYRLGRARWFR